MRIDEHLWKPRFSHKEKKVFCRSEQRGTVPKPAGQIEKSTSMFFSLQTDGRGWLGMWDILLYFSISCFLFLIFFCTYFSFLFSLHIFCCYSFLPPFSSSPPHLKFQHQFSLLICPFLPLEGTSLYAHDGTDSKNLW